MKVLFLDVDGVLNSQETLTRANSHIMGLDPYMCLLVHRILMATGAELVLSSSWRGYKDGMEELHNAGFRFLGETPRIHDPARHERGHEIQEWLDAHPEVEKYAILDDDNDMLPDQVLFQTSFKTGLTDEVAEACTNYLGNGS